MTTLAGDEAPDAAVHERTLMVSRIESDEPDGLGESRQGRSYRQYNKQPYSLSCGSTDTAA